VSEQAGAGQDSNRKVADVAKYKGLHSLRHSSSWCINRKLDGGLELPAKVVQERLGHSTIAMTLDIYGHLFPRHDDSEEMAAAERVLLGA
jgi:integrase